MKKILKVTKATIVLLTLIILTIGAVSATDITTNNTATDNQLTLQQNNTNNTYNNEVSTLQLSQTQNNPLTGGNVEVNNDNYGTYFTDSGTTGINDGDTVTITGNLEIKLHLLIRM